MAKPKLYEYCSRCGERTALAFAGMPMDGREVSLCSPCAVVACRRMFDLTIEGSDMTYALNAFARYDLNGKDLTT